MARQSHPLAGQRVWARRRTRARSLLLSIAATVVVLSFCLSGTVGLLADASLASIRSTLAAVPADEASVVLRAPVAHDPGAQDAGVRAVIRTVFEGAPLTVSRAQAAGSDTVRWTITPIANEVTVADLGRLSRGYSSVEAAVTKSRAAHSPAVALSGHGASTIVTLVRAVGAQQTVEPIPITALALAGIVALLLARNLLTESRRNETRLLRSRGASGRTVTELDARESLLVCAVGTVVGSVAAQAVLFAIYRVIPGVVEIAVPPLAVFVIAVAITVTAAALVARAADGSPRAESGRRRATAPLTITGLGVVIAAIALWRFEQNGTDGATFDSDPSAVLAPAALLCVAVVLCLLAAGRVTARVETVQSRGRSVAVFPARSVNRHIAIVVGPTALLAIALALATVTATYSGTWERFAGDSQQLATGGDLRATLPVEPLLTDAGDLVPLADFSRVPGVAHAAVAARQSDTFGDVPVAVVAVPATEITRLIRTDSTVIDSRRLATDLGAPETGTAAVHGLALPAGATAMTVGIDATAPDADPAADAVQVTLWLGDSSGELFPANLRSVPITVLAAAGTTLTVSLPSTGGPWVIEAIDASVTAPSTINNFAFRVTSVSARVSAATWKVPIPSSAAWTPRDDVFGDGTSTAAAAGTIGFERTAVAVTSAGSTSVRIMPKSPARIPVVLSRPFAAATGLVVGSKVAVAGQWASFNAVVTGIVASVPGATNGDSLIADLPTLQSGWLETSEQIPSADEVWMSSAAPAAAAARIHRAVPSAQVRLAGATGGDAIIRSATTALWVGTIGTSAFAVIALVAAILALLRRRTVETRALRALGLSAGRQAALRSREVGILAVIAVACGAIAGVAVSLLVTATMARLSTPDAPAGLQLDLEFDPVPVAITLALLIVAIAACAVGYGSAVRRQAGGRL